MPKHDTECDVDTSVHLLEHLVRLVSVDWEQLFLFIPSLIMEVLDTQVCLFPSPQPKMCLYRCSLKLDFTSWNFSNCYCTV